MEKIIILIKEELSKEEYDNFEKKIREFLGGENAILITDPNDVIEIHKIKTND